MICSASSEAAAAGARVLLEGGNAFDATVAIALVEGLTLPAACGLGGDAFAVFFDARTRRVSAIGGSGAAPIVTSPDRFLAQGQTTIPPDGWGAVTVPGEAHALWTLHQRFGSKAWRPLVEPAIRCAEDGVALSDRLHHRLVEAQDRFRGMGTAGSAFVAGAPAAAGGVWRRPDYGWTLRHLAEDGAAGFYTGDVAAEFVRSSESGGGIFSREDLAGQRTEVYEPIQTTYRDVTVWETRPPSQGFIVLEVLNLLEGFDVTQQDAARAHLMIEALKLAYADRIRYVGDPRTEGFSLGRLLSKDFARRRREAIDPEHAATSVRGAEPSLLGRDTTSFCVADREGNVISYIHSLFSGWGSAVVAGRTGLVLNNRGSGFSLDPDSPNRLAGGKRPMHTLNCYLLTRGGEPWVAGNTPGGDMQVQWNAQVISNLVDLGMDVQQAVEAPRWQLTPGTDPALVGTPFEVLVESRLGDEFIEGLRSRGHRAAGCAPWAGGCAQLISLEESGAMKGGSDPRLGGVALGL